MADSTNDLTYTPTTWADGADGGTPITAARLNNIERGINNATKQVNANTKGIKTLGDSVSHAVTVTSSSQPITGASIAGNAGAPVQVITNVTVGGNSLRYQLVVGRDAIRLYEGDKVVAQWNKNV